MSQPITSINQYTRQEQSMGSHFHNDRCPDDFNSSYHQLHTNVSFKPSHQNNGKGNTQYSLSVDKCETGYLSTQPKPEKLSHVNLLPKEDKNSVKPLNSILKKEQHTRNSNFEERQHLVPADSSPSSDVNRSNLTNLSSTYECIKRNEQNRAVER